MVPLISSRSSLAVGPSSPDWAERVLGSSPSDMATATSLPSTASRRPAVAMDLHSSGSTVAVVNSSSAIWLPSSTWSSEYSASSLPSSSVMPEIRSRSSSSLYTVSWLAPPLSAGEVLSPPAAGVSVSAFSPPSPPVHEVNTRAAAATTPSTGDTLFTKTNLLLIGQLAYYVKTRREWRERQPVPSLG